MVFLSEKLQEHWLRTVMKTVSGVLSSENCKNDFHDFFLDFWATVFEIFEINFLPTVKSKKAIFRFENFVENF